MEYQLVKVFLSKIDKRLSNLALFFSLWIIVGGRHLPRHSQLLSNVCTLYQHDVTDLKSLLVEYNKSQKVSVAVAWLAEAEVDNTLYCWSCE